MNKNIKQQGNIVSPQNISNYKNIAKKYNNKIDAAAWIDRLCCHYNECTFNSNIIKVPYVHGFKNIFGNRILSNYYGLTVSLGGGNGWFNLGVADSTYKKKESLLDEENLICYDGHRYYDGEK